MPRQRPSLWIILLLSLLVIFTGEIGIHYVYSWRWAWPLTHDSSDHFQRTSQSEQIEPTKIIILSDPHIQCSYDKYEPWLFRWDADNYLRHAVRRLLTRLEPDMVVVTGDMFAEGYKANELVWLEYLQCMYDLLAIPANVRLVVLPGDNDIGGEGDERMKTTTNKRFISEFGPLNEVITFNRVTLVKLNTVSYIHQHPMNSVEIEIREQTTSFLKSVSETTRRGLLNKPVIVFSHVPLSEIHPSVVSTILSSLTPDYIFTGHIHHTQHNRHTYTTLTGHMRDCIEWTIPTSSYRMGESHMAAGAIFIDGHGRLEFSLLWLPPRYPVIIIYILFFISIAIIIIYNMFSGTVCRTFKNSSFHK